MSFKNDMNATVTEKKNTGSVECNTFIFPDPESILDWIEWCIEMAPDRGKPYLSRLAFKKKEY